MSDFSAKFELQRKSWGKLKQIRPTTIDLGMVERIRRAEPAVFTDPTRLEALILELGLNDDGLDDFPASLLPHCGHGLKIWQYPRELAAYLAHLVRLEVRSYLELGTRHGGTFVVTVESLARCGLLESALGVDIMPCPSMLEYVASEPRARFAQVNTQSDDFARVVDEHGPFDAALIDANHSAAECRRELSVLAHRCRVIAFHDIANTEFPEVGTVWNEVKALGTFRCFEYISGYREPHTPMGLGLAIKVE